MNVFEYDLYIFDCDGVVLDSNTIKTEAFRNALSKYDKAKVDTFINYHKDNGGISRYRKFEYFFKDILNDFNEQAMQDALDCYAALCLESLVNAENVSGVIDFLKKLNNLNKDIYINSGGDEKELIQVFKRRGQERLFSGIYGSPKSKSENTKIICTLMKDKTGVFFGDSRSDYIAANDFNLDFIFISKHSEWKDGEGFCISNSFSAIVDFTKYG